MKIQVKKTADGAGICFSDNGVGNWRNKSICVLAEAWKQRKSGACRLPECQYINGLKKVLCKTSQYGSYLIFDRACLKIIPAIFSPHFLYFARIAVARYGASSDKISHKL